MVYYKDNPELKDLQIITTFNGEKEYRKNCKFINEKYYVIDRDCFYVQNKWRRIDSGELVYDWERKSYSLMNTRELLYGLVADDKNKLILGYFSPNPYNNIITSTTKYGQIPAISEEILKLEKDDWFEDMKYHFWMKKSEMTSSTVEKRKIIQNNENPAARGYNIEDNQSDYALKIKYYNEYPTKISKKILHLSKYLGDLTFGSEFELYRGSLPLNLQNKYGVVPCRDGSLEGGIELVTIPFQGAKGLQTLCNLADDLIPRGEINLTCSYHIHFGNFGTDKLTIIALYKLCRNIQEELFSMFPYYKTNHSGIKQKNYTKKLKKLNIDILKDTSKDAYEAYILDSWNKLFNFYGEGEVTLTTFNKRTREHPIHNKWQRPSRYYYFNFMNLFFTNRHTLEARLHGGTLNKYKIVNWLFICAAIIKYAQKYSKSLITQNRTISIKEVLSIFADLNPKDAFAEFLSKYLYNYFLERQTKCKEDWKKNDFKSLWDITEDKQYIYTYKNENLLV